MLYDYLPLSLTDYPKNLSAVLYFAGCSKRCPYCFNELLHNPFLNPIHDDREIIDYLENKISRGHLRNVVLSGGEPLETNINYVTGLCSCIKSMGYDIKLNTNGIYPDDLIHLLKEELIDYVQLDLPTERTENWRKSYGACKAYLDKHHFELRKTVYKESDSIASIVYALNEEHVPNDTPIRFNRYKGNKFTPFDEREEERLINLLTKTGYTDKRFEG